MKQRILGALAALLLLYSPALADWTGKNAIGTTITFKNAADCTSVSCIPINQLVDGSGNAIGVTGSPLFISFGTGVTLPAFTSPPQVTLNTSPSLANGNGVVPTQGGAVLSATNGAYTNLLQGNAVIASGNPLFSQLTAGSAIAGKFGIDQTTPGTTNGVQVNAALPPGTNLMGKVGIDQTTPGTTNGVVVNASTPEGTTADTPCTVPTSTTACSLIAVLKALTNVANSPVPLGSASGGWTPKLLNALSTTVTSIKSSAAGQLGLLQCSNSNTATVFIQVFDVATAGAVTLGTTTPKLSFEVPPGTPSGYTLPLVGIQFAAGIQVAATTTATGLTAQSGTLPNCNAGFN
jgi:hypothetical protein